MTSLGRQRSGLHETYRLARRLSGCRDEAAWLARQQPDLVGGRLPFSFMSELQVSLALPGSKDQHYAAEASVVDRVAGSVLSSSYKCGGGDVTEWVVLSQLARSNHAITVKTEADGLELARDSIRVVAWAELFNRSHQQGSTDWRMLQRVMAEIEETGRRVPGLYLQKLVVHVDELGRCSEPVEVTDSFHDAAFVTFSFRASNSEKCCSCAYV